VRVGRGFLGADFFALQRGALHRKVTTMRANVFLYFAFRPTNKTVRAFKLRRNVYMCGQQNKQTGQDSK
jgi:hypothetical protein